MMNARLEELRSKFQENPRRYFAPFANELRKTGDTAQAISVCRAHLAGQPGHVSGHIVLGQALYEAGEAGEARDIFTAALELDPENLIALRSLGEIAQVNGEFGMARQWYERLLDADPRNSEVSQLLKDIPSETSTRSAATLDVDASEPAPPEALPDGAKPVPEPQPASSFHTSFTGSQPVYKDPEEELAEEEPPRAEFVELEPTVSEEAAEFAPQVEEESQAETESWEAAAEDRPVRIDSDALPSAPSMDEARAEPVVADESSEERGAHASHDSLERNVEPPVTAPAAEVDADMGDALPETETPDEFTPPAPAPESPRALFAEHGFEGPVDDQIGWMTTPSAALSDLESAPEDWFDEPAAAEREEITAEPRAEETPQEMRAPEHATDSWFEEVQGASAIEPTHVSNEEFWLPPELPQLPTSEVVASTANDAEEDAAEVAPMTTAEVREVESETSGVEVVAGPAAAGVMSGPPAEDSAESWSEPVEPEPIEAAEWVEPVAAEPVEATQWSEPIEAEPAESARWGEPVEHEPVDAARWSEPVEHEPAEAARWSEPVEPDPLEATRWGEPVEHKPVEAAQSAEPAESATAEPVHAPEHEATTDWLAGGRDLPDAPVTTDEPALPQSLMGRTPSFSEAVTPPTPAPFVTETLAELYLQQGFREEALNIYRQLAERNPGDEQLRLRIQAIELREVAEVAQTPDLPAETRAASQSVRTFFSRLARRAATPGSAGMAPRPDESQKPEPEVPFAAAASALATLFSASRPPASDESAATTLAGAFTDPAGRPSRTDDRELSLDHLFRDVPPSGPAGTGVSLDEFYSSPVAPPGSPAEPGEAEGSAEPGGTDIRQFTAWLEGLRKK